MTSLNRLARKMFKMAMKTDREQEKLEKQRERERIKLEKEQTRITRMKAKGKNQLKVKTMVTHGTMPAGWNEGNSKESRSPHGTMPKDWKEPSFRI